MGVVYEAEDQRLGRHVALKLIAGSTAPDPAALDRFYREARIASALNHPGICTIHEIDETDGQPFLIMELLDGQSLDRMYAGHAVPLPRLIEIGIQLTDALEAAHRKGILHRDIKPANIFITGSGQAKILDFGLARIEEPVSDSTQSGISDRDKLTRSGATLGTVAYMSPEQARGEPLDARSDVFSLGVVLYELATGNHPFSGTTSAVVFDKLLNYHPPSAISLNHDLPPEFEAILNKALEKDRDLRYQSAADLRADLRRVQRGSSGLHTPSAGAPAAVSYPGMTRAGAAAPATAPSVAAVTPVHLELVPPRPRGPRFHPRLFIGGIVALLAVAAAIAGIQHFAQKKSVPVTNVAGPSPSVTAAATHSTTADPTKTVAARVPDKGSAQEPGSANPAPATVVKAPQNEASASPVSKPSAGTPLDAKQPHADQSDSATPPQPDPSASSFEADAGAPANGNLQPPIAFRRAYAAAPTFAAHHMHRFGGFCEGTLQLTPERISFTSPVHSFDLTRDQIESVMGDAIVETGGRRWRFEIPGRNGGQVHGLLNRWFNAQTAPPR